MNNDKVYEEIDRLLMSTEIEGIEGLCEYMNNELKFYDAPCSGGNHLAKPGGLAEHSLNVFKCAEKIARALLGTKGYNAIKNDIIITALLHDLGKCGDYGKPNYIPNILKSGKQSDTKPFQTNSDLLYIDHEIRSVKLCTMFIDLTEQQEFAILYHNGLYGNFKYVLQGKETPLYMIIHWADMWASRVIESEG